MVVAIDSDLSPALAPAERLSALAVPAAIEAMTSLAAHDYPVKLPVFLGVPPNRPGRGVDTARLVAAGIQKALVSRWQVPSVETIEAGHAAGAMALQAACEALRSGLSEFALAGGVDSYFDAETLEWLEANDQVHSAGPENNPYGFVPGEAAGFVLLASGAVAKRLRLLSTLELVTAATTQETKLIKTDMACTGEGLIALFRALAACLPLGERVDHLYCDMNGETYRADEYGFATIRVGGFLNDSNTFTAPADCWGDVGAASGPLFLLLAEAASRKGYASGPVAAGFTSSESGERCGFVARAFAQNRD